MALCCSRVLLRSLRSSTRPGLSGPTSLILTISSFVAFHQSKSRLIEPAISDTTKLTLPSTLPDRRAHRTQSGVLLPLCRCEKDCRWKPCRHWSRMQGLPLPGCVSAPSRRRYPDSSSFRQGRAPYHFLAGVLWRPIRRSKCGLTQRLSDLSTVEELVARFEVVAESVVTEVRVLFSQIGIPNTFIDPLNEF
jgi:hypothetical protein